jgi:hypothetical protein
MGELGQLKVLCNQFLDAVGRECGEEFHQYFYSIRNFIFHQYRDLPGGAEVLLDAVVRETIDVVPMILSTYSSQKEAVDKTV